MAIYFSHIINKRRFIGDDLIRLLSLQIKGDFMNYKKRPLFNYSGPLVSLRTTAFLLAFVIVLSFPLSGCQQSDSSSETGAEINTSDTVNQTQQAFEDYVLEEFQDSFDNDLIGLHFTLKDSSAYDIEKPENAFPPLTAEYNEECQTELKKSQEKLASFDRSELTEKQQLLHETLTHYVDQQIKLSEYSQFTNLLSADRGISSQLPVSLSEYAFYSEEDIKDYLSLLTQIPDYFTQALAWEQERAAAGYTMTDFEIQDTVKQIDHFLKKRDNNLLIDTFNSRIEALSFLSEDQKNTYKKNNESLINTVVFPAFTSLKSGLTALESIGSDSGGQGLSSYEGGREYYELLIQSMTLSDRSLSQMTRTLEKRMKTIMKRVQKGYKEDSNVYQILADNSNFTTETPEEMLDRLKTCIEKDYPALPDVSYTVAPIPDALKDNTTAAYYMIPPLDSTESNKIYYNDEKRESTALFTTLSHEGYPGHLYQTNYFLSTSPCPLYYVMDVTGYKEGWAYYTEIDCTQYNDYGKYDAKYHDQLVELSRCNDEFGYCISSLIDLYVNGEGYTEEQVGDVLAAYGLDATSAKSFYEYAVEEPGAYLQYYIGYLEILSIRNQAEKKLGDDFSAKEFHTAILNAGPCYYFQLENIIDQWCDSIKK